MHRANNGTLDMLLCYELEGLIISQRHDGIHSIYVTHIKTTIRLNLRAGYAYLCNVLSPNIVSTDLIVISLLNVRISL
jgi:hypothetical protein